MADGKESPPLVPWGSLVLVTQGTNAAVPDHFDLRSSKHRIGRVSSRADLLIQKGFISGLHCTIHLKGKNDSGEPIVEIEDHSRHGTYLNREKIGQRRTKVAKSGDRIGLSAHDSKEVSEIAYKLEFLPSGLTSENEQRRHNKEDKPWTIRARKRAHDELQATQSPTKVVPSPPRPRPVKKLRIVSQSSQKQESSSSGSQVQSSKAAGKRRRQPDSQPDNDVNQGDLLRAFAENGKALKDVSDKLEAAQTTIDELKVKNEKLEKELEQLKADQAKKEAETKKQLEQAKADQAKKDAEAKKKADELLEERNALQLILSRVLDDPKNPKEVRSVVELTAEVLKLQRQKKDAQQDLAVQSSIQDRSQTTPPSKRRIIEKERMDQITRDLQEQVKNLKQTIQNHQADGKTLQQESQRSENVLKAVNSLGDPSNVSGSSQSQDSIESQLGHSSSLSVQSSENSELSPLDAKRIVDEEPKSSGTPQGRPPLFNLYGVRGASADTNRPGTTAHARIFRSTARSAGGRSTEGQESKSGEETKGEGTADEETKGQ